MFYVRKEAATAVGSLATIVSPDVAMDRLVNNNNKKECICMYKYINNHIYLYVY